MPLKATKDVLEKCMDLSCLLNELLSRHGAATPELLCGSCLSYIHSDKPAYKNR